MTPVLLAPLGLAALVALAVPLLIHLRRRDESVPTDFAALRWLEQRPRPRQRIRFDEWPLLVVRLLLVALLALVLARPAVMGAEDDRLRVLVAPGADPAAARRGAGEAADVRWLVPGFPDAAGAAPAGRVPLSSLIRQFDAELPPGAPLTIVAPAVLDGVDAGRLRLTRAVRWQVVPGAMPRPRTPRDDPPALFAVGREEAGVRYLRAAAGAWRGRFETGSGDALPATDRLLAWLQPGPVPGSVTDWIGRGGTALLAADAELAMPGATVPLWRDGGGGTLVEGAALGRGRVLRFTRPLRPAAMPELLDPAFAAELRAALAEPGPPPARVAARDYAPVAGAAPYRLPPRDLIPWLAVLVATLFAAERWLATARRRGVAA